MHTSHFLLPLALLVALGGCGSSDHPDQEQYVSTLHEDFNAYEESIWSKADWNTSAPFYSAWCPDQITFANGIMSIDLEQLDCHGQTHASGEYRTDATYLYGKYTVRMKATDVNGTISSFFTYTGPYETLPTEHDEIDIEIFGKDPTTLQVNYWRNGNEHPHTVDLGFDASADFHTYAFTWHPDYIRWYVDGVLVHTVTENGLGNNDSLPFHASKIIMNMWPGTGVDGWSGAYVDGAPATAKYDYATFEKLVQ